MSRNTKDNCVVFTLLLVSIAMIITVCSTEIHQNENSFELMEIQTESAGIVMTNFSKTKLD